MGKIILNVDKLKSNTAYIHFIQFDSFISTCFYLSLFYNAFEALTSLQGESLVVSLMDTGSFKKLWIKTVMPGTDHLSSANTFYHSVNTCLGNPTTSRPGKQ